MLSRSLVTRSRRPTHPSLLLQQLGRSYAAAPPPPPPSSSTFSPKPLTANTTPSPDRDLSLPPPLPPTPKKPPVWASLAARVVGINPADVRARAEAAKALPPSADGSVQGPSAKELREQMMTSTWLGKIQAEKARKTSQPKEDGTWEDLTLAEKMVPDLAAAKVEREPYKQKKFEDVMSPGMSYALQAILISGIWLLGVFYPPDFATLLKPRSSPAGPDANSKEGKDMVIEVERKLQQLAVVKEYRKLPGWYECRPYTTLPDYAAVHSLTAGTLRGPSKLAVPPLVFAKDDESEALILVHLGRSLCGHDGIVHGGMVATILDEATGRNALLNLPTKIGVTANLNINYRAPTKADQFVVIKTKLTERKGRKAVVNAEMWTLGGDILAEASAVYVEPKWASLLSGSGVEELLGKRPESAGGQVPLGGETVALKASGLTAH